MRCLSVLLIGLPLLATELPPPCPQATEVRVGSYYFPGFFNAARWSPLVSYGGPTPLLGHYRDGAPGVSDWHIRWAVENGISYFVFDWYYDHRAGRVSAHNTALEEGFLKAEHRSLMDFALMWCNEESAGAPLYTAEQMQTLGTNLGRYFREPNYLRIAGRPVVVVSRPQRLVKSFGARFREMIPLISRQAGLPEGTDVFFVALAAEPDPTLREMGFAATTAYNYAGRRASKAGSRLRVPYDDMVESYEQIWKRMTAPGELPYIVPVSPGWDSRPWYGTKAFVRTGSTPAKFGEMCQRAKRYVNPDLNLVIAECWNEFGEGSYLEPCEENGFGYLHALRDAFCPVVQPLPDRVPSAEEKLALGFQTIPADPWQFARGEQAGNLCADPAMAEGTGWVTYDGGPCRYAPEDASTGHQCLALAAGQGYKMAAPVPAVSGRTYRLSAWVKCAPEASVVVQAALFGTGGKWLGRYERVGTAATPGWTQVVRDIPMLDPEIEAFDLEFVAAGGAAWIDDASLTVVKEAAPPAAIYVSACTDPTEWVCFDGSQPTCDPALVVAPGQGVKTVHLTPVQPGDVLRFRVRLLCDELATATIHAAAFGADGQWLEGTYFGNDAFSCQTWTEVAGIIRIPADSPATSINLECVAGGGSVRLGSVRLDK